LRIGYLPQIPVALEGRETLLDHAWRHADPGAPLSEGDLRTFLHRFLFSRDDVFKPLFALSGGERARAALAALMLGAPDLLVLDEPTNHLDPETCEHLEEALRDYRGAIVAVSHDRAFLRRLGLTHHWETARGSLRAIPLPEPN
jgi:ATP-binding cassette subfamily F protein 3